MSSLDDVLLSSLYNGGNRKDVFFYGWDLGSTRMPNTFLLVERKGHICTSRDAYIVSFGGDIARLANAIAAP